MAIAKERINEEVNDPDNINIKKITKEELEDLFNFFKTLGNFKGIYVDEMGIKHIKFEFNEELLENGSEKKRNIIIFL